MMQADLIELSYDIEKVIDAKPFRVTQRLQPAVDLINRLERVIQRQLRQNTFEFLGLSQRMLGARRKQVHDHAHPLIPANKKKHIQIV